MDFEGGIVHNGSNVRQRSTHPSHYIIEAGIPGGRLSKNCAVVLTSIHAVSGTPTSRCVKGGSWAYEGDEVGIMKERGGKRVRIVLYGHFGQYNFGNESTLQAILYNLRRAIPNAEITCVCTGPEATAAAYNIAAVPVRAFKAWNSRNPVIRLLRKVFIGIPRELCRWLMAFRMLMRTDLFIVPGTGLLTDSFGLMDWGPYNLFRWSLIAKLCRCKLLFVSVGGGPIRSVLGRFFTRAALSFADFRSYRDASTKEYLSGMGVRTEDDPVFPDLAFSLPDAGMPNVRGDRSRRPVIGLGVMHRGSMYGTGRPSEALYQAYIEALFELVKWLLAHEYDIRLLIGDIGDRSTTREFSELLRARLPAGYEGRIIDEPVCSVEQLLAQLADTELVVATRFHHVLLALVLNRPVISISFHSKCTALMDAMGLTQYCEDINRLSGDKLIQQFCALEKNAVMLRPVIKRKTEECRQALDEQYRMIFEEGFGQGQRWKDAERPDSSAGTN